MLKEERNWERRGEKMNDFREYSAAFHARNDDVLHFGILGMKWGVRRFQNKDGSLTSAGKRRYSDEELDEIKKATQKGGAIGGLLAKRRIDKAKKNSANSKSEPEKKEEPKEKAKPMSKENVAKLEKVRNSFKTDEAKDKWQKALETDIFDLDFLEYTQNDFDEMSEEEARVARLKEYAKYCQDRKKYMTRWN